MRKKASFPSDCFEEINSLDLEDKKIHSSIFFWKDGLKNYRPLQDDLIPKPDSIIFDIDSNNQYRISIYSTIIAYFPDWDTLRYEESGFVEAELHDWEYDDHFNSYYRDCTFKFSPTNGAPYEVQASALCDFLSININRSVGERDSIRLQYWADVPY